MIIIYLGLFTMLNCFAHEQSLALQSHPFTHDLGIKIIPAKTATDEITICCHGYGHNGSIVDIVHSFGTLPGHLVGFNFPDHDINPQSDHSTCSHGTPHEVLPLLYLIKYFACDLHVKKINLYGFSAGGGAIVNALAILNNFFHGEELNRIGINKSDGRIMFAALEKGIIILDCPLKSMAEIQAFRPHAPQLALVAERYKENNMEPIEALSQLVGLILNILVHFQNPDEILYNRDDALFIDRLTAANSGNTWSIIGYGAKHNGYHKELWDFYKKLNQ